MYTYLLEWHNFSLKAKKLLKFECIHILMNMCVHTYMKYTIAANMCVHTYMKYTITQRYRSCIVLQVYRNTSYTYMFTLQREYMRTWICISTYQYVYLNTYSTKQRWRFSFAKMVELLLYCLRMCRKSLWGTNTWVQLLSRRYRDFCVYIFQYMCIYIYKYVRVHMYHIFISIYRTHIYIHVLIIFTYMHIHMYTSMYICTYICMNIYMYVCTYIHIYVYIYIYIDTYRLCAKYIWGPYTWAQPQSRKCT